MTKYFTKKRLHIKYKIVDNFQELKNNRKRIYYIIQTKYGLLKILKDIYIKGVSPTIKNAINPNQYFINLMVLMNVLKYNKLSTR